MLNLTTTRTEIRPLDPNDFPEIISMYQEPNSNEFIPPLQQKTEVEYLDFLQKKSTVNHKSKGLGFWTIRANFTAEFIGTTNLNNFEALQLIHLGVHLKRSFWGKGYASEVMAAIRDYGFQQLQLPQIYGIVSPQHLVSKKMLERAGLRYQKTMQLHNNTVELYCINKKNNPMI